MTWGVLLGVCVTWGYDLVHMTWGVYDLGGYDLVCMTCCA